MTSSAYSKTTSSTQAVEPVRSSGNDNNNNNNTTVRRGTDGGTAAVLSNERTTTQGQPLPVPEHLGVHGKWQELPTDSSWTYYPPTNPYESTDKAFERWQQLTVQDLYRKQRCSSSSTCSVTQRTGAAPQMKSPSLFSWRASKSWKEPQVDNSGNTLEVPQTVFLPNTKPVPPTLTTRSTTNLKQVINPEVNHAVAQQNSYQRRPLQYRDRKISLRPPEPTNPTIQVGPGSRLYNTSNVGASRLSMHPLGSTTRHHQDPLHQWQMTAENYIDSDVRKRHRMILGGRNGCMVGTTPHSRSPSSSTSSSSSLTPIENAPPIRKLRSTLQDRELQIPRKKLVVNGPLYSTSYSHFYSRVFNPNDKILPLRQGY